jgi:hypothetical protein
MKKLKIGAYFLLALAGLMAIDIHAANPNPVYRFLGIGGKEYDPEKAREIFERYVNLHEAAGLPVIDMKRAKKFALTTMPQSLENLRVQKKANPALFGAVLELQRNQLNTLRSLFTDPQNVPDELFEYWRELIDQTAR